MKKLSLYLFFTLIYSCVYADQTKENFLKAADLYEKKEYQEALSAYQAIERKTPSIYFNMGCCYYAVADYAHALASWRHAQRNATVRLLKKIEPVLQATQTKLSNGPDSATYRLGLLLQAPCSARMVQILFLLLLALVVALHFWGFARGFKIGFLYLVILAVGTECGLKYWFLQQRYAVVVADNVSLYAGPEKEFHKIDIVHKGRELKVVEQAQSWYKVYFLGQQGWVEKSNLDSIW